MLMIPVSVEGTWWTEAHAVWIEAFALIGILVADLFLAFFTLQERREARRERRQVEIARQRSEVTLAGITALERTMRSEERRVGKEGSAQGGRERYEQRRKR